MKYILKTETCSAPHECFFVLCFPEGGVRWISGGSITTNHKPLEFDTFEHARSAMNKVIMFAFRDEWVDRYRFNVMKID